MGNVLVCGAGGFIGFHIVRRLRDLGHKVIGVDLKYSEFECSSANQFYIKDLSDPAQVEYIFKNEETFDEVYQLAADMGGAGYIFTGKHDAELMTNSASINLNICKVATRYGCRKILYTSSACIYPAYMQDETDNPGLKETMAYPADPDSEYGWEKLFSERLYFAYQRNHFLDVRVCRLHNIFGPCGTYQGGREKAPAAICRKVAVAPNDGAIEIWGDGEQTRSFLYIDDCIEGIMALMGSKYAGPVNIGSEEQVSINQLAQMAIEISGKNLTINNIDGPQGVRGRNSHNTLVKETTGWQPKISLRQGMEKTYKWIESQI